MSGTIPSGWPSAGRTRRCSRCSARAIWRSPSTSRRPDERYQGIVPLEGGVAGRGGAKAISPSPSRSRPSSASPCAGRGRGLRRRRHAVQHLPEGEEGRDRLHTRLDHPEWEHVAVLGRIGERRRADRPGAAARRPGLAAVPRRGARCARCRAGGAVDAAAAATPTISRSVIARFPAGRARGDGRRGRHRSASTAPFARGASRLHSRRSSRDRISP